jgi:hypothetical protein
MVMTAALIRTTVGPRSKITAEAKVPKDNLTQDTLIGMTAAPRQAIQSLSVHLRRRS